MGHLVGVTYFFEMGLNHQPDIDGVIYIYIHTLDTSANHSVCIEGTQKRLTMIIVIYTPCSGSDLTYLPVFFLGVDPFI